MSIKKARAVVSGVRWGGAARGSGDHRNEGRERCGGEKGECLAKQARQEEEKKYFIFAQRLG